MSTNLLPNRKRRMIQSPLFYAAWKEKLPPCESRGDFLRQNCGVRKLYIHGAINLREGGENASPEYSSLCFTTSSRDNENPLNLYSWVSISRRSRDITGLVIPRFHAETYKLTCMRMSKYPEQISCDRYQSPTDWRHTNRNSGLSCASDLRRTQIVVKSSSIPPPPVRTFIITLLFIDIMRDLRACVIASRFEFVRAHPSHNERSLRREHHETEVFN